MSFQEKELNFPSVGQGWGIVGLALVSILVFSPVMLLDDVLGKGISLFLYYALSMGGVFFVAHFMRKSRTGIRRYDFSLSSLKMMALVSVSIIAIQVGIVSPLANLLPMSDSFKQIFIELGNQKGVFPFLTIVVAAPILEELIFRGIILDGFLRRYSPVKSIVLSSFLFGIVHFNPWQFIAAFLIGLLAGWVYYKTRKLSLTIIIHVVNNLVAFVGGYFQDAEEAMSESFIESYGGVTNMILIIVGGILASVVCVYLLKKQFETIKVDKWQNSVSNSDGVANSVVDVGVDGK
ncbi:MAG: type II CAAX endopeptidase family protein [Bacteroidales bacterium]|nr:type II CAAX endopeptidase family protein [Bacteroidales bacterium]MDY0348352.1 type II CAAX endopeptidase family protein [Tenuifilaceae bacterium]